MRNSLKTIQIGAGIGIFGLWCLLILTGCESAYYGGLPPADPNAGYGIVGYISRAAFEPGIGIDVTLTNRATGATVARTQSDALGKYAFYPLRPGSYRLKADTAIIDVSVVDGHVRQDISLAGAIGGTGWSGAQQRAASGSAGSQGSNIGMDHTNAAASSDTAPDNTLRNLLLSSSWCSFSFKSGGSTGYSSTSSSRVTFHRNGTYSKGARSGAYSSGSGGTYASEGNSGASGRWQVNNGRLFISDGNGPLEAVDLKVTYNNEGWPILIAEGKEYSSCK